MKQTPAALKWLAEKRARVAHDLEQTTRIAEELTQRVQQLTVDLASLDHSIRLYDKKVNPSTIEPINGWRGTYGKRGGLREAVLEILTERAPEWVVTGNIEVIVCGRFGLRFESAFERKRWYQGGFRATLKKLVEDGYIERENDPMVRTGSSTRWRLKNNASGTLADLTASVTKASDVGVTVPSGP